MVTKPLAELLTWYVAMGADEAIGAEPLDRLAPAPAPRPAAVPVPAAAPPVPTATAPLVAPSAAAASAREPAAGAQTLAELEAAALAFDGRGLKRTAPNTVFAGGSPEAPPLIVCPGR